VHNTTLDSQARTNDDSYLCCITVYGTVPAVLRNCLETSVILALFVFLRTVQYSLIVIDACRFRCVMHSRIYELIRVTLFYIHTNNRVH
jgi:hypothetical protein